jgi:hypothetical protein
MHLDLAPGGLQERLTSERSISERGADRVWLHDSALPLRIFFKRERTHHIDTDSQGKVLNPVKKIERGGRGVSSFRVFPQFFPRYCFHCGDASILQFFPIDLALKIIFSRLNQGRISISNT